MSTNKPERFLRLERVLERTGLSRSTLYRKVNSGTFPRQLKISERCAAWRETEVEEWLKTPI
jgi:prophage regulatory protein